MNATNPSAVTVETLTPVAYQGVRIITTDLLAAVYGASAKNISDNYLNHTDRFIAGKHFFKVVGEELGSLRLQPDFIGLQISPKTRHLILWTERGAARHAKMLDTDQAWEVFEKLEDAYFRPVEEARQEPAPEVEPDPITVMGRFVREVIEPAARLFGTEHAARVWNAPGSPLPSFAVSGTAVVSPTWPIPTTAPRSESSAPRLNPGFREWWGLVLRQGEFAPGEGWPVEISGEALYGHYRTFTAWNGETRLLSREGFGGSLWVVMPSRGFHRGQKVRVEGVRRNGYHLPSLAACRAHFDSLGCLTETDQIAILINSKSLQRDRP